MKNNLNYMAIVVSLLVALPALAAEKVQPVRMGCGLMTFDTVPGWGLRPDGKSAIGPTHGGVAIDKAGNIYTSANKGVFVFSPDGKVIQEFLGDKYSNIHDMKIREEGGDEFIYGARNNNAEGIKFNAQTGEIVLKLPFPKESGLELKKFNPTAITVAPNGDIFLSDGYASNHIFKFDKTGKYLMHFGTQGERPQGVQHRPRHDARHALRPAAPADLRPQPRAQGPPAALRPRRKVHRRGRDRPGDADVGRRSRATTSPCRTCTGGWSSSTRATRSSPCSATTPIPRTRVNYNVPQEKWIEGIFSGTHGSSWDKDGNLYVQDWNVAGRIMKLVRVKQAVH